jgi:hypothetical protein
MNTLNSVLKIKAPYFLEKLVSLLSLHSVTTQQTVKSVLFYVSWQGSNILHSVDMLHNTDFVNYPAFL